MKTEKPDFKKLAQNNLFFGALKSPNNIYAQGCRLIWSDYVEPLQSRIEELQKDVELLNVRDAKRQKKFEQLNKENGGLYAEKERLEKEIQELMEKIK